MTVKTGNSGQTLLDGIDTEIAEIVALKAELAELEETEKALKEKLVAEMLKDRRQTIEFSNGLRAKLYQDEVGDTFFHPSYIMNRMKMEIGGVMTDLIPFETMVNLVSFVSQPVDALVTKGRISETDAAKLFVSGHSVRDEHLRFF